MMPEERMQQQDLGFALAEASAADRKRMLGTALQLIRADDTAHAIARAIYEQSHDGTCWWSPEKGCGLMDVLWGPAAGRSTVFARQAELCDAHVLRIVTLRDERGRKCGTKYGVDWPGIARRLSDLTKSSTRTVQSRTRTIQSTTRTWTDDNPLPSAGAGALQSDLTEMNSDVVVSPNSYRSEMNDDDDDKFIFVVKSSSTQSVDRDAAALWKKLLHGREPSPNTPGKTQELLLSLAAVQHVSPRYKTWVEISVDAGSAHTDATGRQIENRGAWLKTCCADKLGQCGLLDEGDDKWRRLGRLLYALRPYVHAWLAELRKAPPAAAIEALPPADEPIDATAPDFVPTKELYRRRMGAEA
jgi:hypothetical protein